MGGGLKLCIEKKVVNCAGQVLCLNLTEFSERGH